MPETKEKESASARAQPVQVMISSDQFARQELAEQMAALKDNPLDKAKRRGGYFLSSDGKTAHDAEGRIIEGGPDDEDAELPEKPVFIGDARESAGVNRALGDGSTEELGGTENEKGVRKAAAKKGAAAPRGGRR